jgi:hypothetical protein
MLTKMTAVALSFGCILACTNASAKEQAPAPTTTASQVSVQKKAPKANPVQKHRRFKRASLPLRWLKRSADKIL